VEGWNKGGERKENIRGEDRTWRRIVGRGDGHIPDDCGALGKNGGGGTSVGGKWGRRTQKGWSVRNLRFSGSKPF